MNEGMVNDTPAQKKVAVLFNDALSTFLIWLYGVGHVVKDHSYSKKGNPLPPLHGLIFLISSKRTFICTTPGWNEK